MKFKKFRSLFVGIALTAGLFTACGSSSKTSDTKDQSKDPSIVSVSVSAIGVLDKLDANLIGVPVTSMTIPDKYKDLTKVGKSINPDLEVITSLNPNLVILDATFKEKMEESLKPYNLNSFYFQTNSYTAFINSIDELGKKINKEKEAKELIDKLNNSVKEVNKKRNGKQPTVAIMYGSAENYMLGTDNSYLGDLVKTVGGKNITSNLNITSDKFGYAQFSLEQVVEQNPDFILRFAHGDVKDNKAMFDQVFDQNPAYKELDAVKNNRVVDLDPNIFNVSANLNVTEAIKTLGDILYGE